MKYSSVNYGTYTDRDSNVLSLRFISYKAYLLSPLWKIIREEILRRDNSKCRVIGCNSTASQVHHISYSINALVGISPGSLFSLCVKHHQQCEFNDNKTKKTLKEAIAKTFLLVSGLNRTRGKSNPAIGHWYRERDLEQEETRRRIFDRLVKLPKIYSMVRAYWELEDSGATVWSSPIRLLPEEARELGRKIQREYKEFFVSSLDETKTKVRVVLGSSVYTVWTEEQLIYLRERARYTNKSRN